MLENSCPEEKRAAIQEYLCENLDSNLAYYKAKNIAKDLGLSSREVGANLRKLADETTAGLIIEPHAETRATTWRVERQT